MKGFKKYCAVFAIGGTAYAAIELIWRGRTHWSMVVAGGICLVLFSVIESNLSEKPLVIRVLIAAGIVTAIELVFGLIFNVMLGMNVWDYSDMPFNLFGQICPTFFLLWCALSLAALPFARLITKKLDA